MTAMEQKLIVFAHLDTEWAPCGQLTLTEEGPTVLASSFAYGLRYLERAGALEVDPVSLSLRDRAAVLGQVLFPANALPLFGGIRDAAPDAWGRRVIEAKLKVPANSLPESAYLLHAGSERVGALDVRTSLQDPPRPSHNNWDSLHYLMEAADRIEQGLPIPANLEAIFQDGSALGGARPKASVRDADNVLWLAKFSSHSDRFSIPAVEAATLRLAAECGLTVPPVMTLPLGSRIILMIRRFDRYWAAPGQGEMPDDLMTTQPHAGLAEKRLAFVSGLTLLGCDETQSRTKSYADLAQAIRRHCHPTVIRRDNRELFARMVYNILVSNDDDHLRNHGFVWDPRLPGWRLSPLYDVMPRPSLAFERQLHLGVGQLGRAATLDNAMTAKEAFTLSEPEAAMVIAEVWSKVREWRVYFEAYGVPGDQMDTIAPAFRHLDDVSSPALRRMLP
ncbi:MAG: type II toxin-antitoxin system HipA family toxin [Pseudogulbenkiania sp.]|nr:type II toxin-antitoxin system HipA family toxin [Pseudogulbenkiania sp.]